jgi:OOP family OmpA-OmpF porin
MNMRDTGRLGVLGALLSALLPSTALAQQGTALSQFDPAPTGDHAFGVQSADVRGAMRLRGMLLLDYAHDPLVLRAAGSDVGSVVSSQFLLHFGASLAVANRALFSFDLPAALVQTGDDPTDAASGLSAKSPSSAQVGDLRLGVRVRLLGPSGPGTHLALGGHLWLPTGPKNSYVSDGSVRGSPFLVLGGEIDRITWSTQLGVNLRPGKTLPGTSATPVGNAFTFGAALGYYLDSLHMLAIGPEVYGQNVLAQKGKLFDQYSVNAEALLDLRFRPNGGDWVIAAGAGPGLGKAAGTPDFRAVAMLAYSPEDKVERAPVDTDGDGIVDTNDACPATPGPASSDPKKNGCPPPPDRDADGVLDPDDACPDKVGVMTQDPKTNGCPPDRDGDGIVDAEDACVDVAGQANEDPKKNGCPPDKDGDGIVDAADACVDEPGVANPDPKKNGCPPDKDGDGILDSVDACPDQPGVAQPDPKKNGCPRAMLSAETKVITITEQVHFEHAKATIQPDSFPLLGDIAKILQDHPEITRVQIQGHTDSTGSARINRKLSADRADAVLRWLEEHGIEKKRLASRGFGPDKPIANNKTEEGRALNRRVEFHVEGNLSTKAEGGAQ